MARTIPSSLQTLLDTKYGMEPINVIEIQWTEGGQRTAYADNDISDQNISGRIMALSGLDFVININNGSDSAEISVTLNDTDGQLKSIIDSVDIHKRPVWIYQWASGVVYSAKALIFQGEINSP